jgi:hypothetical protein
MPPPVFWQKSLHAIENKGWEAKKERQERQRGGKWPRAKGLACRGAECSDVESTMCAGKGRAWRLRRILGAPFVSRIGRQAGMPMRIAGGTGWRSALRSWRCESTLRGSPRRSGRAGRALRGSVSTVTTHLISRGGPGKLYEGTKMYPCTSARDTRSGKHAMRHERRSAQRTHKRFNKKSNGNEQRAERSKTAP